MTARTHSAPPTRRAGRPAPRTVVNRTRPRRTYRRPNGTFTVPDIAGVYAGLAAVHLRPVLDQRRALELFTSACTARRADSRATFAAVCAALAASMDHTTGAITVTHHQVGARAAQRVGRDRAYSHDTVARVIATLIDAGVLVLPPGLEGKSAAALRSRLSQCPTYVPAEPVPGAAGTPAVDPDDDDAVAAEAARIAACLDAEISTSTSCDSRLAYPSRSRREQGLTVIGGNSFYKGEDRKRSFDPRVVPATTAERRQAAAWLRARLLIGAVPTWRLDAMLARHWRAGCSAAQVLRMICHRPDGRHHGPLPAGADRDEAVARSPKVAATAVDVLLGCVGYRINLWGRAGAPAAHPDPQPRLVRPAAVPVPTVTARGASWREYARAVAARARPAAPPPD